MSDFLRRREVASKSSQYAELDQLISSAQAIRPENIGITIVNRHGVVHAFGYEPSSQIQRLQDADWFHSQAETESNTDKISVSIMHDRPYSLQEPNQQVFSVIRQIHDGNSQNFGTVIIDFDIRVLRGLLKIFSYLGISITIMLLGSLLRIGKINFYTRIPLGRMLLPSMIFSKNYFLIHRYDKLTGWHFTAYFLKSELYKPISTTRNITLTITLVSILVCQAASLIISVVSLNRFFIFEGSW